MIRSSPNFRRQFFIFNLFYISLCLCRAWLIKYTISIVQYNDPQLGFWTWKETPTSTNLDTLRDHIWTIYSQVPSLNPAFDFWDLSRDLGDCLDYDLITFSKVLNHPIFTFQCENIIIPHWKEFFPDIAARGIDQASYEFHDLRI